MATTKANTSLHSSTSLTAGGGDTTSSSVNLTDGYGAEIQIRLTNGGTGPTIAAQVQIEVSPDNSSWYSFGGAFQGGTDSSGAYETSVTIPTAIQYVRTVSGSNTGQTVTLDAVVTEITAV